MVQEYVSPVRVHKYPFEMVMAELYTNAKMQVRMHRIFDSIPIGRGVRQDDTLSSKLFTYLLEDIMKTVNWSERGDNVKGLYMSHLHSADDLVLVAETAADFQLMLNELHEASGRIGLRMNMAKIKIMTNKLRTPEAYERRFPNCPQIPVVIECAITEDSWSADDSQRHTTRRCQLNVEAPYLLKKMIGVDYIYFIQKNHLDLKGRVLEIEATNETFASRVGVVEKCKYYVHPENSEWTCFEQSALLDVKNFFGLENTVEKIAMKHANPGVRKELIESFMKEVHDDGVTELRPWSVEDPEYNRHLRRIVSRGTEPLSPRPVAETRKHSQPGPSKRSLSTTKMYKGLKSVVSNKSLAQGSSKSKFGLSRSNVKLSSPDIRKPSTVAQRISQPEMKKQSLTQKGSHFFSRKPKSQDHLPRSQSLKTLSISPETQLMQRVANEERDARRRVGSHPDLSRHRIESEDSLLHLQPLKPCLCDPRQQVSVSELLCRWDSLLVVLVCSMMIVLLLSAPLTFFLGQRRERR
ncbi:hypothetical protein O3G_MSEX009335 [Manduca sexta]|uniref:Reverse transcriptase n=1 Tax=Manduca sexta TaxID=7130 RepID=A0A921ZCW6_MANSE|nr:hypothetical protein O3G_MSEX009335 [Manduca sexta]KAG6455669.1 hypothetical protein O3G_MSEX009335 [Manduca sexta]